MTLAGKTLFITGSNRGIGLAIAMRAARDGANITIAAKTAQAQPNLPGTIYTAAEEIRSAGGQALPLVVDVRDEASIADAVRQTVETFGGIDICVNNASAISLSQVGETQTKRFDLMHQVNVRGTFLVTRECLPYLRKAANPHVLTLSPPLDMDGRWFKGNVAYTMTKMGMSMAMLGMAEEFRSEGIACNGLWPISFIDTSAVRNVLGENPASGASRRPEIMADAAYAILTRPGREFTGQFVLDEVILREDGVTDFSGYATVPNVPVRPDLFVSEALLASVPTEFGPLEAHAKAMTTSISD